MKKYISFVFVLFLLVIPLFGQAEFYVDMTNPEDLRNPEGNLEYLIVSGDCLWNLADKFYDDPWKWPEIFDANPYVKNPHWIFYDNWLVIPGIFEEKSLVSTPEEDLTLGSESDAMEIDPDSGSESDSVLTDEISGISETAADVESVSESELDTEIKIVKEEFGEILAETATAVAIDTEVDETSTMKEYYSRCGRKGFGLGFQVGYPLIEPPNEQEGPNYGLFIGIPLGIESGPFNLGIGAAILTYDFKDIYPGVGLLANLCINDLLQIDSPLTFQLGGGLFYVIGGGLGAGGGTSVGIPLGNSPFSLRLYAAAGTYQDESDEYNNWGNTGVLLMYSF
jgi:hypothetical protein